MLNDVSLELPRTAITALVGPPTRARRRSFACSTGSPDAARVLDAVGLSAGYAEREAVTLSGGEHLASEMEARRAAKWRPISRWVRRRCAPRQR